MLHAPVPLFALVCPTRRSWKLATGVIDAAQFHHDYRSGGKTHLAAHLVAAADVLCDYVLPGAPPPEIPATDQEVVKELGLTGPQIQTIVDTAKPTVIGLLGVK
jgi:HD-like signal output (HDOD) protein